MSEKIVTTSDNRIFVNKGPINPVQDMNTAHGMALAENNAIVNKAQALVLFAQETQSARLTNEKIRERAVRPLEEQRDEAAERVRAGTAGQAIANGNVELAQKLYNYQELQPIGQSGEQIPAPVPTPETNPPEPQAQ